MILDAESNALKRKLELLVKCGVVLASGPNLDTLVQTATDAGLELSGAQFGAFFYTVVDSNGERYSLYSLAGVDREKFANFPMPRKTAVFAPAFDGTGVLRSDDITQDPRFGKNAPYFGLPEGHLPVKSYLGVPVKSLSGEVLGGLFYGHAERGRFSQAAEDLVVTVAAQAATAIENVRLRDVLQRKVADLDEAMLLRAEASKRLSELAAIVESSDDAILSKDLMGTIVTWNAAATRILGYEPEEMIGQSILKLIPPELQWEEKDILANIRAGKRIDHFETVRMTKFGERLDVELSISPVRNEDGVIVGASKILRDISSRKRMQESLMQAEKIAATGRMAATIAHEINNPLEGVVNLLYLAKEMATDAEQRGYLTAAEGEVARVSHIAKQTLGFYREHTAAVRMTLSEIAADTMTVYSAKCKASGISLKLQLHSGRQVVVRRGELMQVISNLVANAIYAMPDGGSLCIAVDDTMTPEDGVAVTVQDTGVGIPPERMSRIFDAFYTTRGQIGTGIGLFVAKQFVEGHGGSISVQSSVKGKDRGTTMRIFLPLLTRYSTVM